ncbi:MAG: HEAT repeat domain-containing protein [Planctomycetota bacterium]
MQHARWSVALAWIVVSVAPAQDWLGDTPDAELESALSALGDAGRPHEDRARAAATLPFYVDSDPRVLPALVETLRDPDYRVAWGAVLALREVGTPAVPALIASLERGEHYAAAALEGIRTPPPVAAIPALTRALDDPALQGPALSALCGWPSEEGSPPRALSQLPELRAAVPRLRRLWLHPDPWVRRQAFLALWRCDPEALPRALDDSDPSLRTLALQELQCLPGERVEPYRARALVAFDDPNPEVRAAALNLLYTDDRAIERLPQLLRLAHEDPDPEVRRTARDAAELSPVTAWNAERSTLDVLPRVFWRELLGFGLGYLALLVLARRVPRELPTCAHRWGSIAVVTAAPTLGAVCLLVYAHDYLGPSLWVDLTVDFELPWVPFWLGAPVAAAGAFAIVALGVSQRAGGAPLLPDPTDG